KSSHVGTALRDDGSGRFADSLRQANSLPWPRPRCKVLPGFTEGGDEAGMRGYFGIGVEGVSKPMNLGALLRTGHAFGASFAFTIAATIDARATANADTSDAIVNLPFHIFPDVESLSL